MNDPGFDVSTFPDLDPAFREISGARAIAEAVVRRYLTPRGSLEYDPDAGYDVRELLSSGLDPEDIFSAQAHMATEAEKDERVLTATVTLDVNESRETIGAQVMLVTSEGPFTLVLAISKLGVDVLELP